MTERPARATLTVALALFALLGVVGSAYGPAIPALRAAFRLSPAAAGSLLTAHYLGSVAGILSAGWLDSRPARRWLPQAGVTLLAVGCLAMVAAAAWPWPLVAACLIGLGNGSLAAHVNAWGANAFGTRGPAVVNLLNAAYSGGAVLGPAAVGFAVASLPLGYRAPFLAGALVAALLVVPAGGTASRAPLDQARPPVRVGWLLVVFGLVYFLYGGLETASGGWMTTHLLTLASPAVAAAVTSSFWAALAVGRLIAAPLSLRLSPSAFVVGALLAATAAFLLAAVPGLAPIAYPLAGLGLAPVYPTALVWLSQRVGANAIPVVVASSALGGAAFPPLVGAVIGSAGASAVPLSLLAISGAATVLALLLHSRTRLASDPLARTA